MEYFSLQPERTAIVHFFDYDLTPSPALEMKTWMNLNG